MAKIPSQNKRFSQPNNSDLFGNIYYSRNMNFDEEGYIKLSPRSVSLVSSENDTDFNIPTAFGRVLGGKFNVVTTERAFETQISASARVLSSAKDNGTNAPILGIDSHGKHWQNFWYVSEIDDLFRRDPSTGNWENVNVTLTTGKRHPLETFRTSESQTLCIGNGNEVVQIDTSHSVTTNLTILADFEVTGLSFNSGRMGVITKLADGISGQNGEAFFYVWDSLETSANQAYGTGTDFIVAIVPYKSSWVILTRTGNGLLFNGGGFDLIFSLPIYYTSRVWGDSRNPETFGDTMIVDGDVIYININNTTKTYGRKNEVYLPQAPGGILCLDPKVGLYHRWSPSISAVNLVSVLTGGVDTSTDVLTADSGTLHATGNPMKAVDGSPVGGLKRATVYYIIKESSTTFKLATTRKNAINGVAIDLTSASSGTTTYLHMNLKDYGQTRMARTGGIGLTDIPDGMLDTIVFGGEYFDSNSVSNFEHMCFPCTEFVNIGYFVTPKFLSKNVKDTFQKGIIKYRPLKIDEKIIIKARGKDVVGIPVTTPQDSSTTTCTWANNKTLFTTADLSEVESLINGSTDDECEVEIISGAGAGQMSQIDTITEDNGTYSIVLKDEIEGVANQDRCDVLIENWKILVTITPDNAEGNFTEFAIEETSTWVKLKVIMYGVDVTIEELDIPNTIHRK